MTSSKINRFRLFHIWHILDEYFYHHVIFTRSFVTIKKCFPMALHISFEKSLVPFRCRNPGSWCFFYKERFAKPNSRLEYGCALISNKTAGCNVISILWPHSELGHGWVIASYTKLCMYVFIKNQILVVYLPTIYIPHLPWSWII